MNFYTRQHKFYCGIDLHARKMYLCVLDEKGEVQLYRNMDTETNHTLIDSQFSNYTLQFDSP